METWKMPERKVVDNLKTQLTELLGTLDRLYEKIEYEMNKLNSDFDEVNEILIDGFENICQQKAPIDVMSDASSHSSSDVDEEDEDDNDEDEDDNDEDEDDNDDEHEV